MPYRLKTILFFLLTNAVSLPLFSQVLWPGDVNNNGIVNDVDWIYINKALGETGPARAIDQQGFNWVEKTFIPWGLGFPGSGIDYAFADCTGDGLVDGDDLFVIDVNYGQEHGVVDSETPVAGASGSDPALYFGEVTELFPQGGLYTLDIGLGTEIVPVNDFAGITFKLEYDPDVIADILFMPVDAPVGGWADNNLSALSRPFDDDGTMEFALVSLSTDLVEDGSGLIAQLFIVIEDDVVDWQDPEAESFLRLEDVILLDSELSINPVVNDTVNITIVEDPVGTNNLIDQNAIEVFPNPVVDLVYINAKDVRVEQVEVYNAIGQRLHILRSREEELQEIDMKGYDTGIYFLKFYTEEGILSKKIFLQ